MFKHSSRRLSLHRQYKELRGSNTSHANSTIAEHVNVILLFNESNLFRGEAGETEHADLVGDVVPSSRTTSLFEGGPQSGSHFQNPSRHNVELFFPGFELDGSGQITFRNVASVLWWVGVHRPDDARKLRIARFFCRL